MSGKPIYYRAALPSKKKRPLVADIYNQDPLPKKFLQDIKDDRFCKDVIGWKTPQDKAAGLKRFNKLTTLQPAGDLPPKATMITSLWKKGKEMKRDKMTGVATIETQRGKVVEFRSENHCSWDPTHEDPNHIVDDVARIRGFGEASLLNNLRRRFMKFKIYTYVGDIVIAINPYHHFPQVEHIAQKPNVKEYMPGKDPHSYAVAHFSYWNLRKRNKSQSCVVSGESGAGKTEACTFILRYLTELSKWHGKAVADANPVADIIRGVSPFLEAFGNASTPMNSNSSRFGKFTEVYFDDSGAIMAGNMVHYLLEKARLVRQERGHRNFHIFYFFLKGATAAEKKEFQLKRVEDFPTLMMGNCPLVPQVKSPETYDEIGMNADTGDVSETGVRVAFKSIDVGDAEQHAIYRVLAGLLHMGSIEFKKAKIQGESTVAGIKATVKDGSAIKNMAVADTCAKLLGIEKSVFASAIVIKTVPGKVSIDVPLEPGLAKKNTNALLKDVYNKLFENIFERVNRKLEGDIPVAGLPYVGVLDIFGFENFPGKNSFEQLCINYANEKLQALFNEHVFKLEKLCYRGQGMDAKDFPPYNDNAGTVSLIDSNGKTRPGILKLLDDMVSQNKSDQHFVNVLVRSFGPEKKVSGPKCKTQAQKKMGVEFFSEKHGVKRWFGVRHFAGDVQYQIVGFTGKNADKVESHLRRMLSKSSNKFIQQLYSKRGNSKDKTIASKFTNNLHRLSSKLCSTERHYVRCVKPNDFKLSPFHGAASFDAYKTFEQLLYAGVMKIVEIKKTGYPFRQDFATFWAERCKQGFDKVLGNGLSPDSDPKEACLVVCENCLPSMQFNPYAKTGASTQQKYWFIGDTPKATMVLAKDDTEEVLSRWIKRELAAKLRKWIRSQAILGHSQTQFNEALELIKKRWKLKYLKKKLEAERKKLEPHAKLIQRHWRTQRVFLEWMALFKRLQTIESLKRAAKVIQKAYRFHRVAQQFRTLYHALIAKRARKKLSILRAAVTSKVTSYMAVLAVRPHLERKLLQLRSLKRTQAHLRGMLARRDFKRLQNRRQNQVVAAHKIAAMWKMHCIKTKFLLMQRAAAKILSVWRMHTAYRKHRERCRAAVLLQALVRMRVAVNKFRARKRHIRAVQHLLRSVWLRQFLISRGRSMLIVNAYINAYLRRVTVASAFKILNTACQAGDLAKIKDIFTNFPPPFQRLKKMVQETVPFQRLKKMVHETVRPGKMNKLDLKTVFQSNRCTYNALVNLRHQQDFTTPLHSAVKSNNTKLVEYLLQQGAWVNVRDAAHETPLHLSVANGDRSLNITRLLLAYANNDASSFAPGADALAQHGTQPPWIVSIRAISRREQTVLDAAMVAGSKGIEHAETLALLLDNGAQSSVDMERVLEHARTSELMVTMSERRRQTHIKELASKRRQEDKLFQLLFMDPNKKDRAVLQIQHEAAQKKQELQRKLHMVAIARSMVKLQAAVRGWLGRVRSRRAASGVDSDKVVLGRYDQRNMQHQLPASDDYLYSDDGRHLSSLGMTSRARRRSSVSHYRLMEMQRAQRNSIVGLDSPTNYSTLVDEGGYSTTTQKTMLDAQLPPSVNLPMRRSVEDKSPLRKASFVPPSSRRFSHFTPEQLETEHSLQARARQRATELQARMAMRTKAFSTRRRRGSMAQRRMAGAEQFNEMRRLRRNQVSGNGGNPPPDVATGSPLGVPTRQRQYRQREADLKMAAARPLPFSPIKPSYGATVDSPFTPETKQSLTAYSGEHSPVQDQISAVQERIRHLEQLRNKLRVSPKSRASQVPRSQDTINREQHAAVRGWVLIDGSGARVGPFPSATMREWFLQGMLSATVSVAPCLSSGDVGSFESIENTFADPGQCFLPSSKFVKPHNYSKQIY